MSFHQYCLDYILGILLDVEGNTIFLPRKKEQAYLVSFRRKYIILTISVFCFFKVPCMTLVCFKHSGVFFNTKKTSSYTEQRFLFSNLFFKYYYIIYFLNSLLVFQLLYIIYFLNSLFFSYYYI
jgi:hypothetical protein